MPISLPRFQFTQVFSDLLDCQHLRRSDKILRTRSGSAITPTMAQYFQHLVSQSCDHHMGRGSSRGKRKIRSLWISARQVDCCHGTPEFPHKDSFSYQKSTSDFKSGDDAALEKWCPNPTPKLSEMEHKKRPTQWLLSHSSLNLLPTTTVCIRVTHCRTSRVHTQQRRETHTRDAWISCHALIIQYSSQS